MQNNKYELHRVKDPLLPFVFHPEVDLNRRRKVNWHENLEILYCTEGSGNIKCNERVHPVTAGEIVVINSDVIHQVLDSAHVVYHCLIIDRVFCESNGIPVTTLRFQEKLRDEQLGAAFLEICDAYDAQSREHAVYSAAQIRAKVIEFLCLLCKKYIQPQKEAVRTGATDAVKATLRYIKQNYTRHLTLEELAAHAGISQCYLAREFKKYTGNTVFEMVIKIRCKEANRLLQTGATVSQAASACGFESISYFSKTFKKVCGVTPSQCIKK